MLKIRLTQAYKTLINNIFINNRIFILILMIYLVLGLLLIYNNYIFFNSDGISYLTIALKYFNGNITDAINGYWGPLFSWLLVPFLYIFGSNPPQSLFADKILSLIIGLFTLIGFKTLLYSFGIDKRIINIMLLTLIPEIIHFVFYRSCP